MRIAFYAPLKPPDHDVASGDRRMARAIIAALKFAGHDVVLASRLQAWSRTPADQEPIQVAGARQASLLIDQWRGESQPPDLWMTYHLYYRAPDWIGPPVSLALGIPYAVVEASFAMKRASGPWARGHDAVAAALAQAAVVFALKDVDIPGLAKVEGFKAKIISLPPFLDGTGKVPDVVPNPGVPVLLAVAMMRARAKLDSYRFLATALRPLLKHSWRLQIAGDGPARSEVEAAFADFPPGRIVFVGAKSGSEVAALYAAADIFVWPGLQEGFGMVYLEAQAAGLPVVATASGGVHNVVVDGVSGRLVPPKNPGAYSRAIEDLLIRPEERRSLGLSAARFVSQKRNLATASEILDKGLRQILPVNRRGE